MMCASYRASRWPWRTVRYGDAPGPLLPGALRTLNFARAAETCNVSQPALTRAVRKLEEELGAPLQRRERLLTHLTDLAVWSGRISSR